MKKAPDSHTIEVLSQNMANPLFEAYFEENKEIGRELFIAGANQLTKICTGENTALKARAIHAILSYQLKNPIIQTLKHQSDIKRRYPHDPNRETLRKSVSGMFNAAAKGFGDPAISVDSRDYISSLFNIDAIYKPRAIDFEALNYLSEGKDIDTTENIPHKLLASLGKNLTLNHTVDHFSIEGLKLFRSLAQDKYIQKQIGLNNKEGSVSLITPHIAVVKEVDSTDIYTTDGKIALIGNSSILYKKDLEIKLPTHDNISEATKRMYNQSSLKLREISNRHPSVSMLHHFREFREVALDTELKLPYYATLQEGIKTCKFVNGAIDPSWRTTDKIEFISRGMMAL